MTNPHAFVDIHCHLLPGIDDGAKSWDEALEMARMASADGTRAVIVTPHQLGAFTHNTGEVIRRRTRQLQRLLDEHQIPLQVLPGADVRVEPEMTAGLVSGEVLTLADQRRHVLLELPHEIYMPLRTVLDGLQALGMTGILSHPERNQGLLKRRQLVHELVESGCLMQVTAGSLMGTFGPACQHMVVWMLQSGLVHFVATDAHGSTARRPLLARAFEQTCDLVGEEQAVEIFCDNPAAIAASREVEAGVRRHLQKRSIGWRWWKKRAA